MQENLEMVFCYQNCSNLLWEKIVLHSDWEKLLKFEAEGREFEINRTIYSNSERSEQVLVTDAFLTCSWRFLRSNKLELKLEKIIGV